MKFLVLTLILCLSHQAFALVDPEMEQAEQEILSEEINVDELIERNDSLKHRPQKKSPALLERENNFEHVEVSDTSMEDLEGGLEEAPQEELIAQISTDRVQEQEIQILEPQQSPGEWEVEPEQRVAPVQAKKIVDRRYKRSRDPVTGSAPLFH